MKKELIFTLSLLEFILGTGYHIILQCRQPARMELVHGHSLHRHGAVLRTACPTTADTVENEGVEMDPPLPNARIPHPVSRRYPAVFRHTGHACSQRVG